MKKINGNHTGRSCAIDFGSELQVCPILIEDLECPGHMLIEVFLNPQVLAHFALISDECLNFTILAKHEVDIK